MLLTITANVLFSILVLASLPLTAVRQRLLMLLHRLLHLSVLAGVLGCGVLFFLPPEQWPVLVQSPARSLGEMLDSVWPAGWECPGRVWLVLAVWLVAVTLPVLTLIDCAARFTRHAAWLEKQARRDRTNPVKGHNKTERPMPRRLGDLLESSKR